ncbi:MAG: type II toxin-antitoxin system HicA family toxin [Mesorhizobium sp.]|nr:MAG: type II toxin-antitoxin system HicA family toxin [Mesorhizobium sp.]
MSTGHVTIPHPRKDMPTGTVRALLKHAGVLRTKSEKLALHRLHPQRPG